jgi:hypothetical protein
VCRDRVRLLVGDEVRGAGDHLFADDTKSQELMKILARQRFDPRAKYDITDADGARIGMIQKVFGKSLLRSTYTLFDAQGTEVATVRERNLVTAIIRRAVGLIPYVGDFADWLPSPTTSTSGPARRCWARTADACGSSPTSTTWTSPPTPSTASTDVSCSRPPWGSTPFRRAE